MQYDNFHEAYLRNLMLVYTQPQFFNAPRGARSRERLGGHFSLTNPRERVCYLPCRKTNIVFNFAEALWYLSGDNSLSFISYYAKSMSKYSMDSKTLTGTAYGRKIFSFGDRRINQWEKVVELLSRRDPDSKRAVILIFDANEWLIQDNIDVSCTMGLQFFAREKKLHMAGFMRANDAFRGIVSDVFSFTFMQEFMARELGLELGHYYHNVGSIHVYEPDDEKVKEVLEEINSSPESVTKPLLQFPDMPLGDNWDHLKVVLQFERQLREGTLSLEPEHLNSSGLPLYWQQVILLFGLYSQIVRDRPVNHRLYERLLPLYQYLFSIRWSPTPKSLTALQQ